MKEHNCNGWLVNTGWSGGKYGVGKRMSLKITRKIIDAIHEGGLDNVEWTKFPVFGFHIPKSVEGVPSEILNPRNTWSNKTEYDETLKKLGASFAKNFKIYESKADAETLAAIPK
jgi:phosphoenolpyruvate carboxykinase (ATP)